MTFWTLPGSGLFCLILVAALGATVAVLVNYIGTVARDVRASGIRHAENLDVKLRSDMASRASNAVVRELTDRVGRLDVGLHNMLDDICRLRRGLKAHGDYAHGTHMRLEQLRQDVAADVRMLSDDLDETDADADMTDEALERLAFVLGYTFEPATADQPIRWVKIAKPAKGKRGRKVQS